MMMHFKQASLVIILCAPFITAQTAQNPTPAASQATGKPAATHIIVQHEDEGDRIFQQNCSRCHNAPEGFSPRISGTIVRHMRIRASLSKHDEEAILKFLNP
jgi:cytochrome c5